MSMHVRGGPTPALLLVLLVTGGVWWPGCVAVDTGNDGPERMLRFTADHYEVSVFENSPARTYVSVTPATASATSDPRMGVSLLRRSWEPRFRVTGGNGEGLFRAEETRIGDFCFLRLRLRGGGAAILNREVCERYELKVRATLKGHDLEATTVVTVTVLDRNDLRPLFSPTTYSARIPEDTPPRSSIAQVTATDADAGSNGQFYYFLLRKSQLFAVAPSSGVLTLTRTIEGVWPEGEGAEIIEDVLTLEVGAIDRGLKLYGHNGVSSTARVLLHLDTPTNRHAPHITAATIQPSDADPAHSQTVAILTVTDEDSGLAGQIGEAWLVGRSANQELRLERRGEESEGEFALLVSSGFIWPPAGVSVTLQARDRGDPPLTSEPITIQLEAPLPGNAALTTPRFPDDGYRVSVSELAPPGTLLLSITLTPPLEYAHYTLSQAPPSLFSIGSESGVLSTADWLTGLGAEFSLEVTEVSSGAKVTVVVTLLDENDHAPVFSRRFYEAVVNESVAIGTTVLLLSASDDDHGENGYITYSLEAGPGQGAVPFAINQFSGAVTTSGRLDFERQSEFRLAARASDWGFPERREARATVRITVLNTNDEPPVWGRRGCSLLVPPHWPIDTPLVTLSALDPDDRHTTIKYSIVRSDEATSGLFLLQPDTGLLLLTRPLATGHTYTLRITATDGDHASDPMSLNVTVATTPGGMDTPTLSCQETQLAQRLAEKLSRGQHRQEEEGLLGISANQEAGEGLMDLFSANRHAPRFLDVPETIWVPEDTPVGTRILQLQVSDEDAGLGGQLLYSIAGGNTDGCLTVGMRSGDITVFRPMDRERRSHYHVNVTVYDQGSPRRGAWTLIAVVVTDANDNTPRFLNTHTYHTHVAENAAMGTQVFQVSAVDADEGLNAAVQYSLLSEAPFGINASSGLIFVIGQLDREATPTYFLRVEARDSAPERQAQRVATATVEVTITDVNDVAPVLVPPRVRVRVPEDLPLGALVSWPHAADPDEGAGSQLTFDLSSDHNDTFTIDTHTGAVRLNTPLDYETQQVYNITIRVCDGGVPVSLVTEGWLEVEVLDVDENRFAPEFPAIALTGQVAEGGGPGGVSVMKVTARDDDTGRDGQVEYSIRGGSGLGYFSIDQETGVISTNDVLDRETQDSYWLVVYATDMAVVPKSAVVHVYIQVEDVNDNAPLTSEVMYHATVPENSPRDLSVIQISAQDPDAPPSNPASPPFTFRIAGGNARNHFNIHPHTGLITTTSKKLDREQQAEHFLEVAVSDGTHQALVCVCVSVSDVNDNAPVFLEKVFHARVPERGRMSAVTRVLARDRDDGANAAITYAVTDGNQHARFHIHPKTGQVTARKTAPVGTYDILTIKAVDGGRPARWASARLHVEWVEIAASDSAPLEFGAELYNFSVVETERVGEIVGVVSLKNSQHGPVWFEITEGDEGGVFAADRAVGTIVTTRSLDAETHTLYNLTLQASDGTHTTHAQVLVSVLDANDSPPLFVQSVFDVVVTEDTPPGAEILQVSASDRDQHGLTFELQGSVDPASRELFRIDTRTGAIHTTHTLDHESNTQHVLTVMVKESVFPFRKSLCRVLIGVEDVNDHAPLFTMATYEGRVFESAAVGSAFLTVTATDKDRGLNAHTLYSIESGNTGGAFSIDPVLGALSVARPLDSSVIGRYVLSVRATDAGAPPLSSVADVVVSVAMSDNAPPRFPLAQYQATLSEGVPVGTSVVTVTALSRSSLTYRLSGPASSSFSIDQYSGSIVTRGPIDFERQRAFSLTVAAADVVGREAVSTVTVTVLDVNDNAPHFLVSRYHGNVSEGAAPGTLVSDGQSGGPLLLLANDADSEQNGNGQLAYEIADEKARPFFTVDMATGALRTTAQLDHEEMPTHTFQVSVRDRGRPSRWGGLAWVTVEVLDENDTPPSFSQSEYSALLLLPTYQGVELITLPAHDPDTHQSQLRFSLTDGTGGGRWAIGRETGVLSVQNASGWEAGSQRVGVAVSDGRFSSSTQVTVAVQQAQGGAELRFSEAEFVATVAENRMGPQLVTVVTAVGGKLNEPIRFSLLNGAGLFTIGHTSGAIETKVGVALDREEKAEHRLVVQVCRVGDPLRVARATVHITVTDDNDNTPLFVGLPYYAAVQVDSAPGAVVCVVSAVDLDSGPNGDISYFLSEESSPSPFLIDAESGQLKLSVPFEPDLSNAEYQVVVFARDHGVPPLSSSVSFSVAVVNRAMPVFDKTFYSVRVSEDVPVSTPILGINASCPEGQRVLYTLSHTHTHPHPRAHTHTRPAPSAIETPPLFSIGFETGVVSVAAPLDHETSPSHRLVVRATAGVSGAHAEVELEVTVGDVNDNTPTFRNPNPHARVPENAMIGTPVIQVSAVDLDSDKNGVVRYQLLPDGGDGEHVSPRDASRDATATEGSSAGSDWFHLDAVSGLLLTARRLDRERVSRVRLRVRASDQGFPVPRVATATVSIEIGDVNDNAPAFGQLLYEARVTEGALPGQPITRVLASDADQQETPLRYALLPGEGEGRGLFRLNPLTGVLTLGDEWPSTPGTGPRLTSDVFSLDVSVSDGVLTGAAQVHVFVERVNTHSPVFTHSVYDATVTENTSPGSKVITVRATDNDPGLLGQVTYRLVGDAARSWLSVHPSSGLVTTATRLDRELLGDVLEAGLVAEDGGGRHGYCLLRINILDVNDNTPQFRAAEYRVSISAHTPAASLLTQVVATDTDSGANARLAYSLYSEASQPITALLDIDADSGWLVVRSGAGLRAHEGRVLSFFVKAADAGSPSNHALVPVYVHVLGHTPPNLRFQQPQYSFSVPEDTPIGSVVGVVKLQAPPPGVQLSVSIGQTEESNSEGLFVIGPDGSGDLRLQQPLDREKVAVYFLRVSAHLPQQPVAVVTSVEVELRVLDVNDNAPLFQGSSYQTSVPEDTPPGMPLLQVRALDPDWAANGQVIYSLTPPSSPSSQSGGRQEQEVGGGLFVIDRRTGWISTRDWLDHELSPSHSLTVWSCDLGEPVRRSSSVTVNVLVSDVNDNAPIFLQSRYHGSVREGDAPGEVVTVMNTRDDDASPSNRQVSYHITGGDVRGVFQVGVVQGEWKLYTRTSLDREQQDDYIINVTATDGLHAATTSVHITVTDSNDNPPICEQAVYSVSVPEDVAVGSVLLRIKASDADLDENARIRYSLTGEGKTHFTMHTHTGELSSAVELDREAVPHYALVATATDGGGLSCSSQLSITLLDVNDHAPQFSQSENSNDPLGESQLSTSVYEDTPPKALITRIQATDPDLGLGGRVAYSLLDSSGVFSLDAESGVLSLERNLDREHRSSWRLLVCARDRGEPALSSLANVTVTVLDVNDNPPVFARRDYLTTLREDVAVGTEVLTVYAASKDIGTNADIYYSIRHGNQLGHFSIHINTGAISVWRALDFEVSSSYFLTVEARDGGSPPLSSVTMVTINVTDVNDNKPIFSRDQYSATLREDTNIAASIIKVTAEDMDSGVNGLIMYSVVGGDRDHQFVIDPVTGQLQLNKEVDRETVMSYQLSVCARDSGTPPLSSTAVVTIEITDINDNAPTFTLTNHSAVIQENAPVGSSILQLSVTDRDSTPNGAPFLFVIQSGNEGKEFHLDKEEGLLTSNQIFRRDVATEYTLHVQVWDSGRPSLSSGTTVVVRVIEESVHPPSALPLKVHIVAMEDEFPGGVIGQIQATDSDTFDVLTFGHAHQHNSLFKVSPQDGRVLALSGLDVGTYSLNVTVSDGRFSVGVPVNVHVEGVSPEMLLQAVTLRFDRVAPPTFLLRLPELRLRLAAAMATPSPQLLHVLSLQPVETGQLDLLVAVETPDGGFYKAAYVAQKLAAARRTLDQVLRVSAILDKNCSSLDCREAACEQRLELDSHDMLTHSTHTLTHTLSYVTPRFLRHTRCVCTEGVCVGEVGASVCEGVCPQDMRCVSSPGSSDFSCQCPPGKQECAGHSSLSFSGSSFIQYGVSESVEGGAMRVSLRIRTLQSWGIIMYTHTHACTQLKLEQGELWFQVDCGGSSGLPDLGISGRPINDGRWHHVTVELRMNHSSLSLDDSYVEQRRGRTLRPLPLHPGGPDSESYWLLVFGAGPDVDVGVARGLQERRDRLAGLEERRDRRPVSLTPPIGTGPVTSSGTGFQGCLDALQLNGVELPLQDKRSVAARVLRHAHLTLGCSLAPDACQSQPCRNGGTCSSQPGGGFWCSCSVFFTGAQCETELSVCVPNPCKNAGQCRALGNAFLCSCRRGYTGLTCEEDVNECEGEECENGGVCVNTFGSFFCNCSSGFVGRLCRLRPVLVPDMQAGPAYLGREELIGVATVLSLILLLVLLFVGLRKRVVFRKSPSRLALDPAAAALLHKANGAFPPPHTLSHTLPHAHSAVFPEGGPPLPPQVPVRPMAYTPCFQGNEALSSRGGSMSGAGGGEGLEMSSFLPTEPSPRILSGVGTGTLRRGVVVCSVAPTHTLTHTHTHSHTQSHTLPPASPARSDTDSLHKSPWHSDEGKDDASLKGSVSEVQSLSSFQSDSADDNASIVTVIRLVNDAVDTIENEVSVMDQSQAYNRVYHWDTSDWMPASRLPDIEEVSAYENADSCVAMPTGAELETDYYLGGAYDIDESPPPQGEELQELSPPISSGGEQPGSANTTLSRGQKARPQFHPSQYLPPHQLPLTDHAANRDTEEEEQQLSINPDSASKLSINTNSASDLSTPCCYGDSETDSLEEMQQQTEV